MAFGKKKGDNGDTENQASSSQEMGNMAPSSITIELEKSSSKKTGTVAEMPVEVHTHVSLAYPQERKGIHAFDWPMVVTFGLHFVMVCLFAGFVEYGDEPTSTLDKTTRDASWAPDYYGVYSDVCIMIFVGFAWLMTFPRKNMYTATGFTYFISAFAFEWTVLTQGFFYEMYQIQKGHDAAAIKLTFPLLIDGLFGCAAVMISFGGMLGKVSPEQLILMTIIEVFLYSFNIYIGYLNLHAVDIGGSIFIHMFGAYFGLACSWTMTTAKAKGHPYNGANVTSDLFAMIGTIFLFMFWPSFNAALAPPHTQYRTIINTVLSLMACVVTTFCFSRLMRSCNRQFNMVDIQNATLAGGVAVGATADMVLRPAGAMGIGTVAAIISCTGYVFIQPALEKYLGLQDTCGIHNLHGMPAIFAAVCSFIVCGIAYENQGWYHGYYDSIFPEGRWQAFHQMAAAAITLAIAIIGGSLTGLLMRFVPGIPDVVTKNDMFFDDRAYWEVPEDDQEEEAKETLRERAAQHSQQERD